LTYQGISYDDFVSGYTNLAKLTEQTALNEKLRTNTQSMQSKVSSLGQNRANIANTYQSGINKLREAEASTLPNYTTNANQISANTRIAAKRLAEVMASRGLLKSGGALMRQAGIYSQGNSDLAQNARERTNFVQSQANQQNELASAQAAGMSDIERQIALAQVEAAQNAQAYQEAYNNAVSSAPLQASLNYPELYAQQTEQAANLLATLLNYNIENNKLQGAVQVPANFKYGDSMTAIMKQLGLLA
jgi:hypothetical protein